MTHPSYCVGIDLGTTYSAAAVYRDGEPRPETLPLGDRSAAVASMVFLAPDGSMLCGEAAQRRAVTDPRRVVREFKRAHRRRHAACGGRTPGHRRRRWPPGSSPGSWNEWPSARAARPRTSR